MLNLINFTEGVELPKFPLNTPSETVRAVNRFKQLIEQYGEDLDAGILFKSMTNSDMARVVAFLIETNFINKKITI
jgi:hypothetical protein